jgi:hypothetical protein
MGELRSAVDTLSATDPTELDDAALGALLVEVSVQTDRLAALRARLTAAHDRRAAWRADGARSEKAWLAERCRLSPGEAGSRAEFARRLAALPQTSDAFVDGTINAAHARAAASVVRDLPAEATGGLDQLVVERGATVDAGRLRAAVDDYAHRAAADSLAARERRAYRNRRVNVWRTPDGGVALDGRLDPLGGETVLTALAALAAPGDAGDDRTAEQRRADALVLLARRFLDEGALPQVGGQRPHVTVVVPLDTLQAEPDAPPAALDRLGSVSGEAARLLACDANITRVVTAGASQPLDLGRTTRVVTSGQRKALAVRDGGCIGCRAPVAWCQAHHVRHWTDAGPTDLANLVLVCSGCHRGIHDHGWQPVRAPNGTWTVRKPDP